MYPPLQKLFTQQCFFKEGDLKVHKQGPIMSISVSEVFVVLFVALLVIQPEKLPEAAHTLGQWLKRLRAFAATIHQEIDKSLERVNSDHERQ